jgi:FkbM family methyltransferase
VEPQKQNFQRLRLNVNQYPEIETLNLAVYSQDNQILNINNQGSCSNIYQGGEPVSTITLQTLLDQHGVVGDDLVLKIDCEAAEYDILPQCSHQLLRRFKIIMMEIHTQKHPVHQGGDIIYDKLQSCGFVKVSDVPLIIYNTGQELGTYIQKWVRQ